MINKLIKEIPRGIVLSFIIFLVLLFIRFTNGYAIEFNKSLAVNFGYAMLYGLSLYFANATLFIYLDLKFEPERFSKKRLIIGFLSSFLVSICIIFLLRIFEDVWVEGRTFKAFLAQEKISNYIVSIIIFFIVTLAFHAFYFYKSYQENKVKEQKIIAGTASAQFESLKNQIDPHFLFNSLNVLSSLIEENPESAQKFTTSLSKIYRYVLEQKDKELVSVAEELNFAKTYMNLLKMRFENSITFEIPEEEFASTLAMTEAKVVPLSLQLLLENCIKHNIVSETKPLHVKISIENNQLVVANKLQKKEVLSDRKGVGLQNIINRYAILTNRKVLIEKSIEEYKIYLPILTKQITIMETNYNYIKQTSYEKAVKRVKEIKDFYGSLISYLIVIPILIFINFKTFSGFQWFWFPMLGWGLGLAFHAFRVFGYGSSWEERKIKEILEKESPKNQQWK